LQHHQRGYMNRRNILSLAGNLTMATLQFLSTALLYRVVKSNALGNWVLFLYAVNLVEAIRSGIIQSALIRFNSGAPVDEAGKIIGAAWYISFIITAMFVALNVPMFFLSDYIRDGGWHIFTRYFSITVICSLPYNFATWLLQSEQQFDKIIYLRMIEKGSFILFIGVMYFSHYVRLEDILISYSASMLFASVFAVSARYTKMSFVRSTNRKYISKLFNFGKYSMGTGVSGFLLRGSDTFIIYAFLGPRAVAVYNIPQKLLEVLSIPIRSFAGTAFPAMSVHATRNELPLVARIMKKYAGALTVFLLPLILAMFLFSDLIVTFIFGKGYIESGVVLKMFMVYAALLPIDQFLGLTLDILNKPHLNFFKTLIMLVVNVAGDIIGIFIFHNVISVAAASIFTFLAGIIFGHLMLSRYLKYSLADILSVGYSESIILGRSILQKVTSIAR